MPIKTKLIIGLLFCYNLAIGQTITSDVVGNAGVFYADNSGINFHWTIGEVAIQRYRRDDIVLTEGFHQSYIDLFITKIWEAPDIEFNFAVFPNPTTDLLTLTTTSMDKFDLLLTNTLGQLLVKSSFEGGTSNLDLGNYTSGVYWLSLFQDGRLIQSFKVLKQK